MGVKTYALMVMIISNNLKPLKIIDISDPLNPEVVGSIETGVSA